MGINGVGKTTTLGKLAYLSSRSNYKTLIAAADTFRAAAVEQQKYGGKGVMLMSYLINQKMLIQLLSCLMQLILQKKKC